MKTIQQWQKELTQYGSQWVYDEFGVKLNIPIEFNGRLRTVYGQFWHNRNGEALKITIAKKLIESNLEDEIYDTLRHELIHYALHQLDKPFRDSDKEFKDTCARLNVSLYGEIEFSNQHVYTCECGVKHKRHNKISDKRLPLYSFPKCGHKLKYLGRESDLEVKFK